MEAQQLAKEIDRLPEAAKQEIEDFLLQLKLRYARLTPLTEAELAHWTDPEIFGVSANDPARADSVAYVRQLREQQWRGK